MVVNIVWARRWMIVRFDQLTGRTQPARIAATRTPALPHTATEATAEAVA